MTDDFSPLDSFQHAARRWWLVVLITLCGGLLGWGFHRLRPPVYETKAVFTVGLDFSQFEAFTFDQDRYQEDHMIGALEGLMFAPPVAQKLLASLESRGIPAAAVVGGKTIFVERQQSQIFLRVRNENPETAALIANLWAEEAYAALLEAYGHALRAWGLRSYITGLSTCTQLAQPDPTSLCGKATLAEVQQALQTAQAELETETVASQGVTSVVSFEYTQPAEIPTQPAVFERNGLILAGTMLGFLFGAVLATQWRRP